VRKSSIFISAALTTFALVMIYAIISAYQASAHVPNSASQVSTTSIPDPTTTAAPEQTVLTPEQAAQVAVQVLGRNDLLSAESSNVNGQNAYKITFISGDVVYVGLDGQVLSVVMAPHVITVQDQPAQRLAKKTNSDNNNDTSNHDSHENEHEGGG